MPIQRIKTKIINKLTQDQFEPSFLGLFVNPFYFARIGLLHGIQGCADTIKGRTLDIGCGQKPYEKYFVNTSHYIGLEIDTPENRNTKKADYFYDGLSFPFENDEFDSVVCFQVFEHVFNPSHFLQQVHRVLKREGTLLMTVPFVWDEHEQPYDFARYTSFGISALLKRSGFEILQAAKCTSGLSAAIQIITSSIYKRINTGKPLPNFMLTAALIGPLNIFGAVVARLFPPNKDFYLDNVILAKRVR